VQADEESLIMPEHDPYQPVFILQIEDLLEAEGGHVPVAADPGVADRDADVMESNDLGERAGCHVRSSASHDYDNGSAVVGRHVDPDGAQEQAGETAVPAGTHHQHVRALGLLKKDLGRMSLFGHGHVVSTLGQCDQPRRLTSTGTLAGP
jgi:hypothetical protein